MNAPGKITLSFLALVAVFFVLNIEESQAITSNITQLAFVTDSQTVLQNEPSTIITVQTESVSGNKEPFDTSGTTLSLISSSASGQFSASSTNWEAVSSLTVNKGWSGRNFYYKDSSVGDFVITARITAGASVWSASQNIKITGNSNSDGDTDTGGGDTNDQATTTDEDTNTTTIVVTKYIYSSHSSPVEISRFTSGSTFQVSAGRERLGFVGNALNFVAKNNLKNENQTVKYLWSFGDGTKEEGGSVSHIYEFPGEYSVVLNATFAGENAVSRTEIKVMEPSVALVSADQEKITLKNSALSEINLNNWSLDNGHERFIFPLDTIVGGNKSLTLARKAAKISGYHNEKIGLYDPTGKEISSLSPDKILGFKQGSTPSPLASQDFDFKQVASSGVTTENWLRIRDFVSLNRVKLEAEAWQLALRPGPNITNYQGPVETGIGQAETNFLPNIELKDFASNDLSEVATITASTSEATDTEPGFFATVFGWPKRVYNQIATTFYGQ